MGTLNRFVGKVKSLFQRPWKTNKPAEQSFKRTMETAQAEASERAVESKTKPDKAVRVLKRSDRNRFKNKPAWWVKFYGKRTRAEVGPLSLHMVGHFGNFRSIKKIGD